MMSDHYPIYKSNEPRQKPSACIITKMSDEDRLRLFGTFEPARNASGKVIVNPVQLRKPKTKKYTTKQQYLEKRIAGKSREEMAEEMGIKRVSLNKWLRQWDILDPKAEQAAMEALHDQ